MSKKSFKFRAFFSSNSTWTLPKILVRAIGINETLLLTELVDLYNYYQSTDELIEKDNKEWFYLTGDKIEERTTMTYKIHKPILDKLSSLGFISERLIGLPAKKYFTVNFDSLDSLFEQLQNEQSCYDITQKQVLTKSKNLDRQKGEQLYITNNNTITDNSNNITNTKVLYKSKKIENNKKEKNTKKEKSEISENELPDFVLKARQKTKEIELNRNKPEIKASEKYGTENLPFQDEEFIKLFDELLLSIANKTGRNINFQQYNAFILDVKYKLESLPENKRLEIAIYSLEKCIFKNYSDFYVIMPQNLDLKPQTKELSKESSELIEIYKNFIMQAKPNAGKTLFFSNEEKMYFQKKVYEYLLQNRNELKSELTIEAKQKSIVGMFKFALEAIRINCDVLNKQTGQISPLIAPFLKEKVFLINEFSNSFTKIYSLVFVDNFAELQKKIKIS